MLLGLYIEGYAESTNLTNNYCIYVDMTSLTSTTR